MPARDTLWINMLRTYVTITHCFVYFNRLPKEEEEVDPMIDVVCNHFTSYVSVKICKQKNAYLLHDLLSDAISMSQEHTLNQSLQTPKI